MKNCSTCEYPNQTTARFCSECGTRFPPSTIPAISASAQLQAAMDHCRRKLKARHDEIPAPGTRAIAPLLASLQLLPADAHASRIAIIESLGETGDPSVLRALFLMASARGNVVRQATALALGRIRHSLSAYLLIPMLADGSSRVRNAAMESLIRLGFPETEDVVMAACRSNNRLRDTASKLGFRRTTPLESPGSIVETANFEQLAYAVSEFPGDDRPALRSTTGDSLLVPDSLPGSAEQSDRADIQSTPLAPPSGTNKLAATRVEAIPFPASQLSQTETPTSEIFAPQFSVRGERMPDEGVSGAHDIRKSPVDESRDPEKSRPFVETRSARSLPVRAEEQDDRDEDQSDVQSDDDVEVIDSEFFDLLNGRFEGPDHDVPRGRPSGPARRHSPGSDESSSEVQLLEDLSPRTTAGRSSGLSSRFATMSGSSATTLEFPAPVTGGRAEIRGPVDTTSRPVKPSAVTDSVTPLSMTAQAPSTATVPTNTENTPSATPSLELPPLAARIPAAGQTETDSASISDAAAETRERHNRNVRRLKEAREIAFRQLLASGSTTPKVKASRSVARRQAQFEATPQSDMKTVCALIQELAESGSPAVVETIVAASSRPQKDVRAACARSFGTLRIPEALPPLLRLLGDKSGTVIEAAVRSITLFEQPEIRPVVLAAGLVTTNLRALVVTGIEEIADANHKSGWEAFLLSVTDEPDHELAAFAIPLLARITGAAHRELYERLTLHESSEIRAAAVEALVRTGEKRVVSTINAMFSDPDARVRSQAAAAAASISSPRTIQLLVSLLFDSSPDVRRNAAWAASQLDDPELGAPVAAALEKEQDHDTIEHLLVAIGNCSGQNALRVLSAYMEQHEGQFRDLAVRALRKLKLPESAPIFLAMLDDSSPTIRRQSIEQLSVLKAAKAVPRIREKLRWDTDENVRAAAARALGEFQDKGSFDILQKAAEEHAIVKTQAAIALGKLGLAEAIPVLLSLLTDASPEIRYQAVHSLGQLKASSAEDALFKCLSDTDELVCRGAEQALKELGLSQGALRRRQFGDRLLRVALRLTPSSLLVAIPGGARTLLVTLAVLLLTVGSVTFYTFRTSFVGAPVLDAERVIALDASTEAGIVAVLRRRGVADIWATQDSRMLHRLKVPDDTTQVFADRRGNVILVMDRQIGRLKKDEDFSLETMETLSLDETPSAVCRLESQDALCVFESGNPTKLRVIGLEEFAEIRSFTIKATFEGLCYVSPDMSLAMMLASEGRISVCQLETGDVVSAPLGQIVGNSTLGGVTSATFTGDGKYAAFGCTTGCVIVDAKNMRPVRFIKSQDPIGIVAVHSAPGSSTLTLLSGTGQIVQLKDDFKESAPLQIEREESFDVCTIAQDGTQVLVANTESSQFDVYGIMEQKLLLPTELTGL